MEFSYDRFTGDQHGAEPLWRTVIFFCLAVEVVREVVGQRCLEGGRGLMRFWRELYSSAVDGGDGRFMAQVPSEGVGGRVERDVPRAKGWKGRQQASLLNQTTGGGGY